MDKLSGDDPLEDLQGPESGPAKAFTGTKPDSARFELHDSTSDQHKQLPKSLSGESQGIRITLSVVGQPVALRILLDAKIAGANISKKHETRLEFYTGMPGHITNFRVRKSFTCVRRDGLDLDCLELDWETKGGIGTGIGVSLDNFDTETRQTLKHMRDLSNEYRGTSRFVRVTVISSGGLLDALNAIISGEHKHYPWAHYCNENMSPKCELATMARREVVRQASGGLIRYPSKNSFASVTEAHIIIANGIVLEYRQAPFKRPRHDWPGTEKNETWLNQQLYALGRIFGGDISEVVRDRWVPLILNQRPDRIPGTHLIRDTEVVEGSGGDQMSRVQSGFTWSKEQLAVLEAYKQFDAPVKILRGPPGSGKSQVLAGIALSYALNGFSVLVCAPTAATAGAFASCLKKVNFSSAKNGDTPQLIVIELFSFQPIYEDLRTNGPSSNFAEADILITTPNFVCSPDIRTQFGAGRHGVLVVHDHNYALTESELLATIFCLDHYSKVRGVIMSTDIREWPLDIASATDPIRQIKRADEDIKNAEYDFFHRFYSNLEATDAGGHKRNRKRLEDKPNTESFLYGLNEFADQTSLSLVSRLLRQNYRSQTLQNQYRMTNTLATYPSKRAYQSNESLLTKTVGMQPSITNFNKLLHTWLGLKGLDATPAIFISTSNRTGPKRCIKSRGKTESKHNMRNIEVVLDLLLRNRESNTVSPDAVKVITPYADQVRAYEEEYARLMEQRNCGREDFPEVTTVDSIRGQQSSIIIYDLVVTCGDASHGIGIVADEYRANLAATRATDMLIIVGSEDILTIFPEYWKGLMKLNKTPKRPLPYIVQYCEELNCQGLMVTGPTADLRKPQYNPPRHVWTKRGDDEDFHPSWERGDHTRADFDPGRGQ